MVQIDPEPIQVLPYQEIGVPTAGQNYDMFMHSQQEILSGSTLLSRAADRVRAEAGPSELTAEVSRLHRGFAVEWIPLTQILRLSYSAADPQVAAFVANAFAEEYIKLHFETRQKTREKARELLKRELEKLEDQVQRSEKELVAYAQSHSIPANENGTSLVPKRLADISSELTAAEAQVFAAQARLASLQKASVDDFPAQLVTNNVAALTSKLFDLEHQLTALRSNFGENWPVVVQTRGEIALVREQLVREKKSTLGQALEQAVLDLTAAENRRRLLAGSASEQEQLVHQLESASIQYNILRREVDTNQKMYEGLLHRLQQTSLTSGMEFGGFHVIEQALPAEQPFSPNVLWNLALGSVLGLALGVCFVGARHYWDNSVSTIEELERLTSLPVLGTLPEVATASSGRTLMLRIRVKGTPGARRAETLSITDVGRMVPGHIGTTPALLGPQGSNWRRLGSAPAAAEGVRNICASILLSQASRPPRLLMVTSSVPGEGKTTIASELGHAFAESGKKTLLVECDLRRPTFGTLFGIGAEGGLSLFLSGIAGAAPVIHETETAGLFVVGAGPTAPNPPTLLGSDKLGVFLREMMSTFHFVILDSPPVLPMADARLLASLVEGVVLVVRAGQSPRSLVRRVCKLLELAGANVLGAVLNAEDPRDPEAQGYGYYQEYYPG